MNILKAIKSWEDDYQDSFGKHFMSTNVDLNEWIEFLESVNQFELAEALKVTEPSTFNWIAVYQPHLYHSYVNYSNSELISNERVDYQSNPKKWEQLYEMDVNLWSDFLSNDEKYKEHLEEFFSS